MKIWKLIASTRLSVGICHEEIPFTTQMNIYYELGVAQALRNETLLFKSPGAEVPGDFVRTEHVEFDDDFEWKFMRYLRSLQEQADHYEEMAGLLERIPILALDYLKRAFLISGEERLRTAAEALIAACRRILKIGLAATDGTCKVTSRRIRTPPAA